MATKNTAQQPLIAAATEAGYWYRQATRGRYMVGRGLGADTEIIGTKLLKAEAIETMLRHYYANH